MILTDMPEMKAQVLSSHGALAIIQLLEVTRLRDVICRLLGLLNLVRDLWLRDFSCFGV